jgi:hypothetical protein
MTKEEFVKKWTEPYYTDYSNDQLKLDVEKEMAKDLDYLIWAYMKKNGLVVGSKKV